MDIKRKIAMLVTGVILATVVTLALESPGEAQPTLAWGSKGAQVQRVQQRLSNWGFYRGGVDGVFGFRTWRAVRSFQAKNGLAVTGTVTRPTWEALGLAGGTAAQAAPARSVSRADSVHLLARVIQGEAAAEPYLGKIAVGAVILNRVHSGKFPNSMSGVIFQRHAFESVSNGIIWRNVSNESYQAARQALSGWDPTGGATFFWNPYKPVSAWIWTRRIITQIGQHVFAR